MSSGLKIWEGKINLKASIVHVLNVEGGGAFFMEVYGTYVAGGVSVEQEPL